MERNAARHGRRAAWRRLEADYLAYHTLPANRRLHRVGVPAIALAVLLALTSIEVPGTPVDLGAPVLLVFVVSYVVLLPRAGLLAAAVLTLLWLLARLAHQELGSAAWWLATASFAGGWIAQLTGHRLEGNRPAFLTNARHLWVAPLALASELLQREGT